MSESTPELWIQNDFDLAATEKIKRNWQSPMKIVGNPWKCPACGEQLEPQFGSCWKCGATKA